VYVGQREWLTRSTRIAVDRRPFFADASIERADFRGQPVIIARRR
jgi:hypothetical protein